MTPSSVVYPHEMILIDMMFLKHFWRTVVVFKKGVFS